MGAVLAELPGWVALGRPLRADTSPLCPSAFFGMAEAVSGGFYVHVFHCWVSEKHLIRSPCF